MKIMLRWLAIGCVEEENGGLSWPESYRRRMYGCWEVGLRVRFSRQEGRGPGGLARRIKRQWRRAF